MHGGRPGSRLLRTLTYAVALLVALTACVAQSSQAQPGPGGPSGTGRPGSAARPNIVFVLLDDLSWNLVQYMPRVQALRQRGVTFSNYFVTNSLCCPSRATIMSGKFPHNSKVLTNEAKDQGGFAAFRDQGAENGTFATSLQGAGYRTGFMGKYLNGYNVPERPQDDPIYVPPGWDEWYGIGRGYGGNGYRIAENDKVVSYGDRPEEYLTDVLAGKAADFIGRTSADRRPFMLEIATFAPHAPYRPAERHKALFPGLTAPRLPSYDEPDVRDKPEWVRKLPRLTPAQQAEIDEVYRNRARTVQSVDELVGRVQAALQAAGRDRDTYVVFSSDNGFHLGEHRMREGKTTAYDEDIRVPLIVTGPGVPAARTVPEPAQNTDLCPTFEDLAGAPPRPGVRDGRSLAPFLHGAAVPLWRKSVLIEHREPMPYPDDPDFLGPDLRGAPSYAALRTPTALYVEWKNGEREYYDLPGDPGETLNRYPQVPEPRRRQLREALNALRNCAGGSCRSADTRG